MSEETRAASPAPVQTENGDAKTGNLSLDAAAKHLLKLSAEPKPEPQAAPPEKSEEATESTPQATEPEQDNSESQDSTTQESEAAPEAASEQEQAEPEADDVLSQLNQLDPKAQEVAKALLERQKERLVGKFEKRIGKEVGKRKTTEQALSEQVQSLAQQLEQLRGQPKQETVPPPPLANPSNPLSNINDISTLNQEFIKAKEAMRTAEDLIAQMEDNNLDSIDYGGNQFNRQQVKSAFRNAKRIVEDYAPQQAQYLQARHQSTQIAFENFPWFKDRNSPEYVLAQKFMSDPSVAVRADKDFVVGLLVEGHKALEARKRAATTQTSTTKPKPKAPSSQTEFSSANAPTRAADSEVSRSRISAEVDKLSSKKGGLRVADAARLLLQREKLQKN